MKFSKKVILFHWAIPDNNEPPPMEDIRIPYFFFTILHWNPYLFRQFCIGIHTFFGNVLGIPDFCLPQVWEIQTLFWYDFWNFILFPAISSLEWEREGIEDIGIPDTFGHAYTLDFYTFSHLLTQEGIEDTGIPYNFVYMLLVVITRKLTTGCNFHPVVSEVIKIFSLLLANVHT